MPTPDTERRFLVIGAGSIGKRHIGNLLAIKAGQIMAMDVRADRRDEVEGKWGIRAVADLDAAWEWRPEVVVITTPTSMHIPAAIQAAERGCHLFIEKPLSHTLDGVPKLLRLVEEQKLVSLVGCNFRFHPAIKKILELVKQGAVGKVTAVRVEAGQYLPDWHPWEDYRQGYSAKRDLGGGVILDAIHELDYIHAMLGKVERVACFGGRLSRLEIETEDTASILLSFESGAIAELHLDYVQREYSRSCHVIGEEGTIQWVHPTGMVRLFSAVSRSSETFLSPPGWEVNWMYIDEMRHLVRCLDGEETPALDVAEARRVLETALLARESMVTSRVLHLPQRARPRPRVVAIVQARMGSSRLPGKVMCDIAGHPMLWHVLSRVKKVSRVDEVVVATSTDPRDDAIELFCREQGFACVRGSEDDVLDRYYLAARRHQADAILRVTADCPLLDPYVTGRVVNAYVTGEYDYVSNVLRPTFPDGLDSEIFSFAALQTAWEQASLPSEREHVTPFIRTSGKFRLFNVENENRRIPGMRLTVDRSDDLNFVRTLYSRLGRDGDFGIREIRKLLLQEPKLMELNSSISSNEGFYQSLAREEAVAVEERKLEMSQKLRTRAEAVIPSATQTFSKGPTQFVQGVAPVFLARGEGSHVWDVDGNEYIDYPMALGPIILGHNYPAVTDAASRALQDGLSFSLPHPLEVEVAELLCQVIPGAEMARFGKNGSDVTAGAVRAARAYTGRDIVACCGYHGWQDWYIGTTTRNRGVPEAVRKLTIPFTYNDVESLKRIFAEHPGQVAAVIMEPVGVVEPQSGFLQSVRELATQQGALLIFDEIVTGFRLALGGAQEFLGVQADLSCLGKAMGNGFPISAVTGRRDVMRIFDEIFFSFTFGGETVSLAAALATINEIRDRGVIEHLWATGQRLKDGYNTLARSFNLSRYTQCIGLAPRTVVTFRNEQGEESLLLKSLFQQECLKRGILFSGGHNVCFSHTEADINTTLRVYRTAMEILADAIAKDDVAALLEGKPVEPVFRKA